MPDLMAKFVVRCCPARHRRQVLSSLVVGFYLLAPSGFAAIIAWSAATTISGDTDVATNGTPLYAYTGGTAATVNGLTFTGESSGTTWGSVSLSGFGSDNPTAFGSGSGAPWSTLTSAYQAVLSGGAYGGASAGTVTLNGLTLGHAYTVQLWVGDNRGGGEAARAETTSGAGANAVTLAYEANQASGGGGVGQYVVGIFVATSPSQSFTLTPSASGSVQLNAINVRDNGGYVFTPTRVNLAKYQPVVTDSVNASQAAQANGLPTSSYITDGLTCNDSYWQSGATLPHWAQVVFPFPVTVGSAQLAMGRDTASPPMDFRLQYLTNATWVDVPGTTVVGNTNKEVNLVFTNPITASSFRFYDSIDGNIYIREMALYPPNGTNGYPFGTDFGVDLARQQPVFATTNTAGSYPLLAVDGRISPLSAWQTTLAGSNSLLVNLQFTNKIGSAHLYSGATGVGPLTNFILQYWTGGTWADIPGGSVSGNTNGALVISFTTPVTTTKVQLVFTNTGVSAVQELCLFSADNNYPLGTGVMTNPPVTTKYDAFTDSYYCLSNAAAGSAGVDSNGVPVLGTPGLTNWATQYQVLLNYDNGTYRLRNRATGLCLSGAQLTTNVGAVLADEPYAVLPDQEWLVQPVDGTNYYLVNQFSGLVVDTLGGSTAPGTPLVQNVMTNNRTQLWQFPLAAIFPKKGSGGPSLDGIQNSSWCYTWWVTTGTAIPTNNVFYPMNDAAWYLGPTLAGNLMDFNRAWRVNGQSQILMGYNEPDNATQANLDPTNGAIYWHNFNNLDMPLAAPAPANAGDSWLPIFFGYITNWGLRVDYLPSHDYPGNNSSASSGIWINSLQSEYNTWGIPIWMTEFGCVDWSTNQSWSEENNYNALAEFMWRAEGLSWLRKYSIFSFGGSLAPNPWTATTPAPTSNCFDTNKVLTPLGELYGAWDGDANVETNKAYYLHHSGSSKRLANTLGSPSPNAQSILVRDNSVQWTLVAAGSANLYYVVSAADGRRLSYNGSTLSLVAPGTPGTAVQWSLAAYQYGWYYLQHPATSKELSLAYTNATFTAAYSMVANTTTGTAVQWRFIVPPAAIPWTGGSNVFWGAFGNWNSGIVPMVGQSVTLNSVATAPQFQGQPVVFNSLSTSNLATVLNTNAYVSTLSVTTPPGPVSIGGTNTLTVGSGIDLSGASQNLTITAPVRLGGSQPVTINFIVTNNVTLSLNGGLTDFGNTALNVAGGGTVSLGGAATNAAGATINASTLIISGSGQLGGGSYAPAIANNGVFNYSSSASQTLFGTITGTGSVTQNGPGPLTLAGVNTYTGNTTVHGGTLAIGSTGELYTPGYIYTPTVIISSGATLQVGAWAYAHAGSLGYLDFGAARLVLNGGTITYAGSGENSGFNNGRLFTVGTGGAILNAAGTGTWYLENDATYGGQTIGADLTLTLTGSGNGQFDNFLTGGGGLSKAGPGVWTLTSTNSYTGPTTIGAGTLAVSGNGAIASSMISLAGGATFNVSGKTTTFALGGGTLTNSSVGATLNGNNDCSLGTLALVTDGTNAAFLQTNGAMTLSARTEVMVNNVGATLTAGVHALIAAATAGNPGQVTGTLPMVEVTGHGAAGATSLQINGTGGLDLVVSAPPQAVISSAVLSSGSLILEGTNGELSGTYSILTSTNVALPLSSWTTNTTGSFTTGGAFSNAVPISTQAQQFFLIKQP